MAQRLEIQDESSSFLVPPQLGGPASLLYKRQFLRSIQVSTVKSLCAELLEEHSRKYRFNPFVVSKDDKSADGRVSGCWDVKAVARHWLAPFVNRFCHWERPQGWRILQKAHRAESSQSVIVLLFPRRKSDDNLSIGHATSWLENGRVVSRGGTKQTRHLLLIE